MQGTFDQLTISQTSLLSTIAPGPSFAEQITSYDFSRLTRSVAEHRLGETLPKETYRQILATAADYEKILRFVKDVRQEDGPLFAIFGSARTREALTCDASELALAVVQNPNQPVERLLAQFPISAATVSEANRVENIRIGNENVSRAAKKLPLLAKLPENISDSDIRQELLKFRLGMDSPSVFGSYDYYVSFLCGQTLGRRHFRAVTGGGPGNMMAGNKGNALAGQPSVGILIKVPWEEKVNQYIARHVIADSFSTRKKGMLFLSGGALITPGGIGTKEEFLQCLYSGVPIAFVRNSYWEKEIECIRRGLVRHGFDASLIRNRVKVTDSIEEGVNFLVANRKERWGFTDEEIKERVDDCRNDLLKAHAAAIKATADGSRLATLFMPDLPESASQRADFIKCIKSVAHHYKERGYTLLLNGNREAVLAALRVAPDSLVVSSDEGFAGTEAVAQDCHLRFHDNSFCHQFLRSVSSQYVVFPGGVESVFRCFETICLLQTRKLAADKCKLRLVSPMHMEDYWKDILTPTIEQADICNYHHKEDVKAAGGLCESKFHNYPSSGWCEVDSYMDVDVAA